MKFMSLCFPDLLQQKRPDTDPFFDNRRGYTTARADSRRGVWTERRYRDFKVSEERVTPYRLRDRNRRSCDLPSMFFYYSQDRCGKE